MHWLSLSKLMIKVVVFTGYHAFGDLDL